MSFLAAFAADVLTSLVHGVLRALGRWRERRLLRQLLSEKRSSELKKVVEEGLERERTRTEELSRALSAMSEGDPEALRLTGEAMLNRRPARGGKP